MYKIAVIGDYESICGFAVLGADTFPAESAADVAKLLPRLAKEKYGIIYITESLAAKGRDELVRFQGQITPVIVPIPGIFGNTGEGAAGVRKSVETAVGSDILFGAGS